MSSVRMCDKCQVIFSEIEDGWQSFQGTTMTYDENGQRITSTVQMDSCPACSIQPRKVFQKELEATQEGRAQDARIAKLERENGIT